MGHKTENWLDSLPTRYRINEHLAMLLRNQISLLGGRTYYLIRQIPKHISPSSDQP